MPSITLMNFLGDVQFTWDEENEPAMIRYIESKMKEGYTFFLVESEGPLTRLKPTTDIELMKELKSVRMSEAEDSLIESGTVHLVRPVVGDEVETLGPPIRDASEVVKRDTVAVRRIAGG